MKIVVDAFGGDYAPQEIVAGAVKALQNNQDLNLVLVGDKDKITDILQNLVSNFESYMFFPTNVSKRLLFLF